MEPRALHIAGHQQLQPLWPDVFLLPTVYTAFLKYQRYLPRPYVTLFLLETMVLAWVGTLVFIPLGRTGASREAWCLGLGLAERVARPSVVT